MVAKRVTVENMATKILEAKGFSGLIIIKGIGGVRNRREMISQDMMILLLIVNVDRGIPMSV